MSQIKCINRLIKPNFCEQLINFSKMTNQLSDVETKLKISFLKAVEIVKPKAMFSKCIKEISPNHLEIKCGNACHLVDISNKQCHLVGFGKAVLGMAVEIEKILGNRLKSGLISVPFGTIEKFRNFENMHLSQNSVIQIKEGAHNNLPDELAQTNAQEIMHLVQNLTNDDILFVCISGGGSALLPLPKTPVTLEEKMSVIKLMASQGAKIEDINIVRIALSDIKGGKLAKSAKNAFKTISFIISDIVSDPVHLIASGPMVENRSKESAMNILKKFDLLGVVPHSIELLCSQPEVNTDTIDPDKNFVYVIGNNMVVLKEIVTELENYAFTSILLSNTIDGCVKSLSKNYVKLAKTIRDYDQSKISKDEFSTKINELGDQLNIATDFFDVMTNKISNKSNSNGFCIVAGGEPTVKITGNGVGGRNQELVLRVCNELIKYDSMEDVCFLSAGTDGIDGPTDAAGSVTNGNMIKNFNSTGSGLLVDDFIQQNDSYSFFKNNYNGIYQIITGHTGTNVMDVHILYIPRK